MRTFRTSLLVFLASALAVFAQTPTEVARSYFAVLQKGQYKEAASFFAATSLKEFRELLDFGPNLQKAEAAGFYQGVFGAGATAASVGELSDSEFFGRFLSFAMEQAGRAGEINFDKIEILGAVPEGDNTRHLVTRTKGSVGEIEIDAMEVVSMTRHDESWKLLLNSKIKGMAAQIQKAFE